MTEQELMEWGTREAEQRKADLLADRSLNGLKRAQEAAEKRRKAVGLSRTEATRAVINANRVIRRGQAAPLSHQSQDGGNPKGERVDARPHAQVRQPFVFIAATNKKRVGRNLQPRTAHSNLQNFPYGRQPGVYRLSLPREGRWARHIPPPFHPLHPIPHAPDHQMHHVLGVGSVATLE